MSKEMRINDSDLQIIKSLFADNLEALKVIRKIFLPELDPKAPIGQNFDLWMTMKIEDVSPEEALINLKARNTLINHVEQCLMQLSALAGQKSETVEETKARLAKNSSK